MKNIRFFVTLQSYNVVDYQLTQMYMKRMKTFAAIGLLVLASCSKSTDLYQPPVEPEITQEDINANVQKVFGVTFDPNHDWNSTISGEVEIIANSTIKKVQVLVYVSKIDEEGETVTSMNIMNEAELNGATTITLNYEAPKDNLGIYVAFIDGNKKIFKKVEGNTVNIADAIKTRGVDWDLTKELNLTLPSGEYKIAGSVESYASQRGWNSGEQLYFMDNYGDQAMAAEGYSAEFTATFRAMIFTYFVNKANNLPLVKASDYYNEKAYPFTTGHQPIIISPVYKSDKAKQYGNEVWNSDLYYYYFKEEDLANASDQVAFLKSLPKYKALAFKDYFGETEDDVIRKSYSYALLYYGDGTPEVGTKGDYIFPKGYQIGFMVRAKTDFVENGKPRKQGELYGDGRLNNDINSYSECNFKSSKLGTDGPRLAYLALNGRKYMCWESGTDRDFNDVIIEIECGLEVPEIPIEPEYETYTYCFEDSKVGDYDLNDIVIKAKRKNTKTVEYSIVACGAYDELYVKNINAGKIKDNAEVHSLFGVSDTKTFINTESGGTTYPAITVTKTVGAEFKLADPTTAPYIYDATTGQEVRMSKIGEDPHGIMIPNDFKYPLEKVCIKNAYLEFNNWGQNSVTSTDWYTKPVSGKVYELGEE